VTSVYVTPQTILQTTIFNF